MRSPPFGGGKKLLVLLRGPTPSGQVKPTTKLRITGIRAAAEGTGGAGRPPTSLKSARCQQEVTTSLGEEEGGALVQCRKWVQDKPHSREG
jgi:hypothetical protein